jgi:hypothetical protein
MPDPCVVSEGEGPRTSDERSLRERAREAILAGKLPGRRPDRMWGGPAAGGICVVCGSPVMRGELEFEIEFSRNGGGSGTDRYNVHIGCFQAWESEFQTCEPTLEAAGPPP